MKPPEEKAGMGGNRMAAVNFDPLHFSLLVFATAIIPGIAIGWPLLRKSSFSLLEKFFSCFFIGTFATPILLVAEGSLGMPFTLPLVLANMVILTAAGVFYGVRENAFSFPGMRLPEEDYAQLASRHAASFLLLAAVLLAFWLRIQTFTPVYSELDPYFYIFGSGQIVREGAVPQYDDYAWWPELKDAGHRAFPAAKMYLEAQWYSIYTSGGAYSNYLLFITSSWLPPLSAAFLVFGAYLLLSSMYDKKYGIFAAYLMAFLPITIFKMSAGVNEAAPFGMASVFLTFGFLSHAVRSRDRASAALAGFALFACALGSNYLSVVLLPLAAFVALQSVDYFGRGKERHESLLGILRNPERGDVDFFIYSVAVLAASVLLANGLHGAYMLGLPGIHELASVSSLIMLAVLAFAVAATRPEALHIKIGAGKRRDALALLALLGLLAVLLPNPAGSFFKGQVKEYVGAADYNVPLERTIAEQNPSGASFEGEAGFLALVPKNYASGSGAVPGAAYGALAALSAPFSFAGNQAISLSGKAFNLVLGTNISTSAKADSLLFIFLIAGCACFVADFFSRKGEERDVASVSLLMLLLILSVTYVGLNKIKYSLFVGLSLVVACAATVSIAERALLAASAKLKLEDEKYASWATAALMALIILAQVTVPSAYPLWILGKSAELRYQDNPAAAMPHLAQICESLRAKGYFDPEICAAGYNATFADSVDSQYNGKVCLVSQLTMEEILPGSGAEEQQRSAEAKTGANFRCNRLAGYWVGSMEWLNRNINSSDRVTSWWDYGHWINYFGDRKAVLRNEHASKGMIGRVAHDYIIGSLDDLKESMNYFDSRYVLFDVELIGGGSFGGKYGALNYLGCAHERETSVREQPGNSDCEFSHSPERILIPKSAALGGACTISESQARTGILAYRIGKNGVDASKPVYCIGDVLLANGQKIQGTYYVDRKDENGDLLLSKGFIRVIDEQSDYLAAEMVYDNQRVWQGQNGTVVDGMEDAKTDFYRSNLYRGFYLRDMPGFDLVYESAGAEVKIYALRDFVGNKEGWVDPVASKQTQ